MEDSKQNGNGFVPEGTDETTPSVEEKLTYEVLDRKDTPEESVILKRGLTAEFTLNNIKMDIQYLDKMETEITAMVGIENAKMVNIEGTHPKAAEMSEEDRVAVFLYQKSFSAVKVAKEKLAEIAKQKESYKKELADIMIQTGLGLTPSPAETPTA